MRLFLIIIMASILTACSGEGGYCVVDTTKTVTYEQDGKLITEHGLKTCYDLEGNIKED